MDEETLSPEQQASAEKKKWSDWLQRVKDREKKFEEGWWKDARKAQDLFASGQEGGKDVPFNVLYANTEVLLPSLYSNTPRPDVQLRGKQGLALIPRVVREFLTSTVDCNSPGIETFDDAMESAVLSALVPAMGGVRIRSFPEEAHPVRYESYSFDELLWGEARKWNRVPWIAFRQRMTKEEIVERFELSEEAAATLQVPAQKDLDANREKNSDKEREFVYELYIKAERKVVFLCEGYEAVLLEDMGDVQGLKGFYPTPGLLTLVRKPGDLTPTPLFTYYRQQAEELNRVSVRLNKVLSAIRVRGMYNQLIGTDLQNLLDENDGGENILKPSQNAMDLQQGFEKQIWLLPIEKLIQVATQLYQAREAIKRVIYEITGLADIVRGASVASETATAQTIKDKWGSVRLRRMQRAVKNYVRDLFRLALDAGTQLPAGVWAQMTQVQLPTVQEKELAKQTLEHAQAMGGMAPPEQTQQAQAILSQPAWEEILQVLIDDNARSYLIDVETDSTLDASAQTDKQEATEFLGALSQLVTSLGGLAALGPQGVMVARDILLAVASKFRFGRELQSTLEKLPTQLPQQNPAEGKELEKKKNELLGLEEKVKKAIADLKTQKLELQTKQQEFAADQRVAKVEQAAQQQILSIHEKTFGAAVGVAGAAPKKPPAPSPEQTLKPVITQLTQVVSQLPEMMAAAMAEVLRASAPPPPSGPKARRFSKQADGSWLAADIPSSPLN